MDLLPTVELFERLGTARVERAIAGNERGRVFYEGTYWPARFYSADALQAEVSDWVTVVGRQGITLLVQPTVAIAR